MDVADYLGVLGGVCATLAGVIVKMAIHTRDLNKQIEAVQNLRIAQADQCAAEKATIYKEWMKSEAKLREEQRVELKEMASQQHATLVALNRTLDRFSRQEDEPNGG